MKRREKLLRGSISKSAKRCKNKPKKQSASMLKRSVKWSKNTRMRERSSRNSTRKRRLSKSKPGSRCKILMMRKGRATKQGTSRRGSKLSIRPIMTRVNRSKSRQRRGSTSKVSLMA